jgi:hypothetical protein
LGQVYKKRRTHIQQILDGIVSLEFPDWEVDSPIIRKTGDKNHHKILLAQLLEDIVLHNKYAHKDGIKYHYSFSKKGLLDKIFRDRKNPNDPRNEEGIKRLFDILYTSSKKRATTNTYILKPHYRPYYLLAGALSDITYAGPNNTIANKPSNALPKNVMDYLGSDIETKIYINTDAIGIAIREIEKLVETVKKTDINEKVIDKIKIFINKELEDGIRINTYTEAKDRLENHINSLTVIQNYAKTNDIADPFIYQQYAEETDNTEGNGRLWCRLDASSLFNIQTMSRVYRNIIMTDLDYIEYDINNCHINILSQYYRMIFGNYHKDLEEYCKNYQMIRDDIVNDSGVPYKLVKDAILAITYGGTFLTDNQINKLGIDNLNRFQIWNNFLSWYKDERVARQYLYKLHQSKTFIEVYKTMSNVNDAISIEARKEGGIYGEYIDNKTCLNPAYKKFNKNNTHHSILSHLFQGIEAISIRAIIKDDPESIVSIHHDGWIGRKKKYRETPDEIEVYKSHLEERVYTETKRVMVEWNNKLGKPLPHPDGLQYQFSHREIKGKGNIKSKTYIDEIKQLKVAKKASY